VNNNPLKRNGDGAAGDLTIVRPAAAAPPRRPEQVEQLGRHHAAQPFARARGQRTRSTPPCRRTQSASALNTNIRLAGETLFADVKYTRRRHAKACCVAAKFRSKWSLRVINRRATLTQARRK
jgi:hypothetical protein